MVFRSITVSLLFVLVSFNINAAELCTSYREKAMVPADPALCAPLADAVRAPSALRLDEYERKLNDFFRNWCHRDTQSGWVSDKFLREVGPFSGRLQNGRWDQSDYKSNAFHAPVVIWYSPEAYDWIKQYRSDPHLDPSQEPPVPDGAMIIKEMMKSPSSTCLDKDVTHLFPVSGAAIMIRDQAASHDGWFWGWYGWQSESPEAKDTFEPDWPAKGFSIPNMGFGQYCMNCHASAANNLTFSSTVNIKGEPGEPVSYLTQDFNLIQRFSDPVTVKGTGAASDGHSDIANADENRQPDGPEAAANTDLGYIVPGTDSDPKSYNMPSQTYDNVWVKSGPVDHHSQYITSDQCLGCHDAGSTGMQFDMTAEDDQDSGKLLNFSPYATWRTSPMGLAGRDPIFFAQLASETQTFHPESTSLVETTCLGCHGILGQRQFQIDQYEKNGECSSFPRNIVNATPLDNPEHANYGALARDGISCTSCHHMVLAEEDTKKYQGDPANHCVKERQATLNPHNQGFSKTFTGSFFVGPADELYGPFEDPKPKPMEHALGITPSKHSVIGSSELCGTCHNVHLPVLRDGETLGHIYEQTTYSEWVFSDYRSGKGVNGEDLPSGQGAKWVECQDCHTPNKTDKGTPYISRIASIQEKRNFPEAEYTLPGEDLDLPFREHFSKHTLVGLNLFLTEMFDQFSDVLGIPEQDPMMVSKGLDPIELTKREMLATAETRTVSMALSDVSFDADNNEVVASLKLSNEVGHKFPSGVGFRRAFVHFEVLDENSSVIWESGKTNDAGVIVDENGNPVAGELWWTDECQPIADAKNRPHQPHYALVDAQNKVQIYQELASAPPIHGEAICSHDAPPQGLLTTSFLSICTEVKDNRLLPSGFLSLKDRVEIALAIGAQQDLAEDTGPTAVGDDPDYVSGGGDTFSYQAVLPRGAVPASVRATLYYQAIPPFYLQDRFCTAEGTDRDRLKYLVENIHLEDTAINGWKLQVGQSVSKSLVQ